MDKIKWNVIKDGGWHFSYVMSNQKIIDKIKSFAHSEYNDQKYLNINLIKKKILERKDLFEKSNKFNKIENEKKLPEYLIKNKKKFKSLML